MNKKPPTNDVITSLQNPKVKNTLLLQKSRERKKQNLFVVEGKKEVYRALRAGYIFKKLFICQEIFDDSIRNSYRMISVERDFDRGASDALASNIIETLDSELPQPEINYVTLKVYAQMSYRKESEGIIGWVVPHNHELEKIILAANPLILVIDAVEKPGNLGAILRTADAAGVDALIISDPRTDIYNPNVVRSSLGALFSTQIGIDPVEEVIRWLRDNQVRIFCTALSASKPYTEINFKSSVAIVMGTEATGLSQAWLSQSDQNIIIPMRGNVDSMNVSVSAGIVLFEALRQRNQ